MDKSSKLGLDRLEFRFPTVLLRFEGLKWRGMGSIQYHSQVCSLSDPPGVTIPVVRDLEGCNKAL